ncbi:UNVERIFIED_CONTAM: BURP domain-containing protein 3 [Sesamum radiatum]|uniref:BURP domain-containing protein 3 n=1 Tax=Sesamum radiatum TaxID=300843 RepID=A0AAW2JUU8_SESRA
MEFKFFHILAFLSLGIVVSHATLPSEEYWNSVLPNSPMPKAVKDLLQPPSAAAEKGKRDSVGWLNRSPPVPFFYRNRAGENQVQDDDDPNAALFFMEKDLYPGKLMKLDFSKNGTWAPFLTRHDADSVPFSSEKLSEILSEFSVDPSSDEAEVMKKTIRGCEQIKSVEGEEKLCTTSLESMIDFATSKLGKDVDAISTTAVETVTDNLRRYRIARVKQMPPGKPVVACHPQEYAYAVFYCHKMETSTVGYKVWMVAARGRRWRLWRFATGTRRSGTQCTWFFRCRSWSQGVHRSASFFPWIIFSGFPRIS